MNPKIRRQLTLFLAHKDAENIEKVRELFNPIQSSLIKSHLTLCREDEIENMDAVIHNLTHLQSGTITISIGEVERFDNNKGVLLPIQSGNVDFQGLRQAILSGIIENPRQLVPHITLMHPRNSTCTTEIFSEIQKVNFPTQLTFSSISLIEQINDEKWQVVKEFPLNKSKS